MFTIPADDPIAIAVVEAIHSGDIATLERLLNENPGLVTAKLGDDQPDGMTRSLLHVATDWPGHFPNGARSVAVLVAAGADVNARFTGPHAETPLHWAASSDDVEVLDAVLDAGADIDSTHQMTMSWRRWPEPHSATALLAVASCRPAAEAGATPRNLPGAWRRQR